MISSSRYQNSDLSIRRAFGIGISSVLCALLGPLKCTAATCQKKVKSHRGICDSGSVVMVRPLSHVPSHLPRVVLILVPYYSPHLPCCLCGPPLLVLKATKAASGHGGSRGHVAELGQVGVVWGWACP